MASVFVWIWGESGMTPGFELRCQVWGIEVQEEEVWGEDICLGHMALATWWCFQVEVDVL